MAGQVATDQAERLAELIRESECTVALTGAGISVPSGIPDFRTPGKGIWEKVDPMEVAHIDAFERDPTRFWGFYRQRLQMLGHKEPNGAHEVLAEARAPRPARGGHHPEHRHPSWQGRVGPGDRGPRLDPDGELPAAAPPSTGGRTWRLSSETPVRRSAASAAAT